MKTALDQAELAYRIDEVPIGAVVVDKTGKVVSQAHNLKEQNNDPCGHAEIIALRMAAAEKKSWRLNDCNLYVTLEPCVMCMGALVQARISGLFFGAYDRKGGAISTGQKIHRHEQLNHRFPVYGGIEHYNCSRLLSRFFREKRERYKSQK